MSEEDLVRLRLLTSNKRLREAREQEGYTQPEFAKLVAMSLTRYADIEKLHTLPSEDEIMEISVKMNQPIEHLFPDSLLSAVKAGVFSKREVNLGEPEVLYLSEVSEKLLPSYNPEDDLIEEADQKLLHNNLLPMLEILKPRQRMAIELRFGLDGGGSRTLDEVSKIMGVTRETIRQRIDHGLRRFRYPERSKLLKPFLD